MHNARSHSDLSASGASRWMHCPGSVRLTRGLPGVESKYASEGTAAHELAQTALLADRDTDAYLGQVFHETIVTPDMARHVQVYVDVCRRLMDGCSVHYIERRFDLAALRPPVPMFGTSDFSSYSFRRRELHVVDLKYGRGVWVAARDNAQLKYYALGAVLSIEAPVSQVTTSVVQPRTAGDPVRTTSIDAIELTEWSLHLIERAHATQQPDAPLVAGDWCRFCSAKQSCAAYQSNRTAAAAHQFLLAEAAAAGQ